MARDATASGLAGEGARVHSVDGSLVAVAKARRLAASRGVTLDIEHADVLAWDWPVAAYDAVVAIFVQFVNPEDRPAFFRNMVRALRPGGVLILEGYGPGQLAYGTGGPRYAPQLYTVDLLRDAFADMEIAVLRAHDAIIEEGPGAFRHVGAGRSGRAEARLISRRRSRA